MLSFLVKPASGACNMRCAYCFYRDVSSLRERENYGLMTEITAENLIKRAFSEARRAVGFCFQGGEPTLAGLEFFRFFTTKTAEYNTAQLPVSFSIQTNGLKIDDEWARFFKENKFLVGLSLDGNKDIHDFLRSDGKGEGTFNRVINAARMLEKHGVDFNILTVVTEQTARHTAKILSFYKKSNFRYLQFIPCLDAFGEPFSDKYSLSVEGYFEFLKTSFDFYYRQAASGDYFSIRYFDNLVNLAKGRAPEQCGVDGVCRGQSVVEADGTVYPCDFYCIEKYASGNINSDTVGQIKNSEKYRSFVSEGAEFSDCRGCEAYALCRGGCRRFGDFRAEGVRGKNIYCEANKRFFEYAAPKIRELARAFR